LFSIREKTNDGESIYASRDRSAAGAASLALGAALTAAETRASRGPDASAGAQGLGANHCQRRRGCGREGAGPQAGLLATKVVYFDFDSSEIKGTGPTWWRTRQVSHRPSNTRVRLEGHTDERGSREYNIGLGERRAQSVRRALLLQGAADAQISTVSYGEERPAVPGHDEAAWAKTGASRSVSDAAARAKQ